MRNDGASIDVVTGVMTSLDATDRDLVVLVDERDVPIGAAPKLDVHRDGLLHRAVSVMLFDDSGRALLQQRALTKYHSPGLWSNTCCGHPTPGESPVDAARRRLREEMGIDGCALARVGAFMYRADVSGGLVEHELDHVFVGRWSGQPMPNVDEVGDWRWQSPASLRRELAEHSAEYTVWLSRVLETASSC
jgi:isopentenyl-diphosphate delta-isomerase